MSLETKIEYLDSDESPHDTDSGLSFALHDLLSDDADWNKPYWNFEIERMPPFLQKLRNYYEDSVQGISICAVWSPDKVSETTEVTFMELENILLNNRLGTKTKYIVRKNA